MTTPLRIATPGVHVVKELDYHADPCPDPSLSSSIAKVLVSRSPLHAWIAHPRLNPNFVPDEDSKFDRGTVAHAVLLEGKSRVHVIDADDWRTNKAKEARDSARAEGLVPLLAHQWEGVVEMVEAAKIAVAECTDLDGYGLAEGTAEQTLLWREGKTWCRARPDWLSRDRKLMLDYKTTAASAEPNDWIRTMLGCGYDIQAAHYLRGNRATGAAGDTKFVFLVQECEKPYACSFVGVSPALLQLGDAKVAEALEIWQRCLAKNEWPAYPKRICWAEPPAWAESKWEERSVAMFAERGIPYDPAVAFGDLRREHELSRGD